MKKIALLIPQNKEGFIRDVYYGCWHKRKFIDYSWPPLLEYQLYSVLKNKYVVKIIDGSILPSQRVVSQMVDYDPDYILCGTGTYTFEDDTKFLSTIKKNNQKIIVYGELATLSPQKCLKEKSIDYAIKGEPESVVLELLDNDANQKILKKRCGICFKEYISPKISFVEDLDALPIPERDITQANTYQNPLAIKNPFTTMLITRGCPYSCIFCTVPVIYGKTFRKRSVENIMKELRILKQQGFKELFFRDENLTLDNKYLINLCKEMVHKKLKFNWMCNSRVDTVNQELLHLMKQAGCHLIKFGVESGNQKILNSIKKEITLEGIRQTFLLCKNEKIDTLAHFMLGHPGETKETIMQTIRFAKELNPLYASFDVVLKYEGTKLNALKKSTMVNEEELQYYHDYAFKSFYIQPKLIIRHMLHISSLDQFKQKLIGTFKLWNKLVFRKNNI